MSSARAAPSSSRLKVRRRRRRLLIFFSTLLLLILICGGLIALARASFLRIRTIDISGESTVATSTLEQFAQSQLVGFYLRVFPKSNIFLYPKRGIEANILAAFPDLASASVKAETFSSIAVTVSGRQPSALWCGQSPATSSPCLLLDQNGLGYTQAPTFSSPVYTSYYGALQNKSAQLPVQFLTSAEFQSLSALVAALSQKAGSGAESVAVDENSDVRLGLQSRFVILFALGDDSAAVLNHFLLALQTAPFTSHPLSDFSYIDLRFGDKLYYKLKN